MLLLRLAAGFAAVQSTFLIPSLFPRSFSATELSVLIQLLVSFLSLASACLCYSLQDYYSFCGYSHSAKVIRTLSLGVALFAVSSKCISDRFGRRRSSTLVLSTLIACISVTYFAVLRVIGMEPFRWLLLFTTKSEARVSVW